jgi:DNA polymerase-3 subunit alpha
MDSTNQTLKDGFEDFSPTIKAEYEFDLLGAFISFHPITLYNDLLRQHKICNSDLLHKLPKGISHIKIAGVIQKKDSRLSDKGVFVSLQLSDNYGIFDLTIFSDKILQNYGHLLEVKKRLMISCEASKDDTSIRLTMFSAQDLEEAIMAMIKDNITIKVSSHEKLQTITQFLHAKKNNYGEKIDLDIIITIDDSPFVAKIKISEKMNLSFEDLKTLQDMGE